MTRERALGSFERAALMTGPGFNAVAVLRLSRVPGEPALRAALDVLQRRHPLLAARVAGGRRPRFATGGVGPIELRAVDRGGPERWLGVVEEELGRGFDVAAGPLARCALVPRDAGDGGEIVFAMHHAVVDATGFLAVCRALRAAAAGETVPDAPVDELALAPDNRFPAPFRGARGRGRLALFFARQAADELAWRRAVRGERVPVPPREAVCRAYPMALGAEATAALAGRARRERVALVAAINAALLLAVRDELYDGARRPLRYFVFPDLRPRLEPPPPADALGGHLTMLRLTAAMARDGFWELARDLHRQIGVAFRRGEKFLSALAAPPAVRWMLGSGERMGSAAASFSGRADGPDGVSGPPLEALHAFVSNVPAGPEVSAQVRLFGGRLMWDFVYLEPELDGERMRALAGGIRERLEAASKASGGGGTGSA